MLIVEIFGSALGLFGVIAFASARQLLQVHLSVSGKMPAQVGIIQAGSVELSSGQVHHVYICCRRMGRRSRSTCRDVKKGCLPDIPTKHSQAVRWLPIFRTVTLAG